jgi:hypothetical protein
VSTYSSTHTYTSTHTATYLTETILGTLVEAIAQLGLKPTAVTDDWARNEAAVLKWIEERSLKSLSVEFTSSSGTLITVVEFPVEFCASGKDAAEFRASKDRIRRFLTKFGTLPSTTQTRLFVKFYGHHTTMPGWSKGTSADRSGLRSTSAGTLATAPGAAASMSIYD